MAIPLPDTVSLFDFLYEMDVSFHLKCQAPVMDRCNIYGTGGLSKGYF